MLKEVKNLMQIKGEPPRRWFDDEYFDLIVWLEPDASFFGFQLCYDRTRKPRALTWTKQSGYRHTGIDDGETGAGTSKASPVLVNDGLFDASSIAERLEAATGELPPVMAEFILEKVKAFKL